MNIILFGVNIMASKLLFCGCKTAANFMGSKINFYFTGGEQGYVVPL